MSLIIFDGKNRIKKNGFCPNPVAKYGIPEYADTVSFPEVKDSSAWLDWWTEQIRFCYEGYETGGVYIPGRYYYYLNFAFINTVGRGFHNPDYIDTDLDFFYLIEYCKKNKKGIISLKARRRGLSFKANKGVIEYGTKFLGDKYMGGICAGLQSYADDFFMKLTDTEAITPPELSLNVIKNNTKERTYGYKIKDIQGKFVETGSLNQILVRTAFQSGNIFKGTQLDDCIFEEAGEFDNLLATYGATKWCFMDGEQMVGTPYIYGTGGNMNKSSKGFSEMWNENEAYELERFWLPGSKIYKPCYVGCTNTQGKIYNEVPNIESIYKGKDLTQTLGMEDEKEAIRQILLKRQVLSKTKNKKALVEHIQNNPLTVEEAFISSADNNYDTNILQSRILDLMKIEQLHLDVVLEFEKDENELLIFPLRSKIRLAITDPEDQKKDPDWKVAKMYKWPEPDIKFIDAVGIDGYNQDKSNTSSSQGGILVYRKKSILFDYYGPIFTYYKRPPRKEDFFLIGLLTSLAYTYTSPNMTLVDANSPLIISFYVDNQCEYLLAYRPRAFESPNSEQSHTYGLKTTVFNIDILEAAIQTEVIDNAENWFDPELCKDVASYNTGDMENDADLHDALLLAMALHKDRNIAPIDTKTSSKKKDKAVIVVKNGIVYYERQENTKKGEYGGDLFMQMLNKGTFNNQ